MAASFLTAFFLGLMGSLHCVGMCGPLALAIPVRTPGTTARLLSIFYYHAGRISTYSLGGLLFGLLGRGVWIAGWQQGFSIGLGLLLLGWAAFRQTYARGKTPAVVKKSYALLQRTMGRLWSSPAKSIYFMLGMANGLLPCGLVYLAIAGALTRPSVPESVGFMAFFGAGTLPLLLGLHWTGRMLPVAYRRLLQRSLPYLTIVAGILLVLRGLDLGIPFLSPQLPGSPGQPASCH